MFIMSTLSKQPPDKKVILAKAVLNAAVQLDLKSAQLARILHVHHTAINRLKRKSCVRSCFSARRTGIIISSYL